MALAVLLLLFMALAGCGPRTSMRFEGGLPSVQLRAERGCGLMGRCTSWTENDEDGVKRCTLRHGHVGDCELGSL